MAASTLLTVFCHPAAEGYIPPPRLSEQMIVCGPFIQTRQMEDGRYYSLNTPRGRFDLAQVLATLPSEQTPDVIVVWSDASCTIQPGNIAACPGHKVLIIGDTHHMQQPIRCLLSYATQERFDTYLIVATRQHAHFFVEGGLDRLFWLPGLLTSPVTMPFNEARRREIGFVGQIGSFHPRRRRVIDALEARGYPIRPIRCNANEAALLYSRSLISLNISLNGDLNFRPYEVLAAGGFLLTDRLSPQAGLTQFYHEGEHYDAYSDIDELTAKLDRHLAHPEAALTIARAGQAAYRSQMNRERLTQCFWDVILQGRVAPEFDLKHEVRIGFRPKTPVNEVLFQAALYEFFQEQHLRQEKIDVLMLPDTSARLVADIADLPRMRIFVLNAGPFPPPFAAELDGAGVAGQIVPLSDVEARGRDWDVVIAPGRGRVIADPGRLATSLRFRHLVYPDLSIGQAAGLVPHCPGFTADATGLPILSRQEATPAPRQSLPPLSPPRQEQLRDEYALTSDLLNLLWQAEVEVGLSRRRVLYIGPTLPESLILDDLQACQWVHIGHRDLDSLDNPVPPPPVERLSPYVTVRLSIEDLPLSWYGYFDVVVCLGAMAEIPLPVRALHRMYHALKSGGRLFATAWPIWSGAYGWKSCRPEQHGTAFETPRLNPWDHLLLKPQEMFQELCKFHDEAKAASVVDYIFRAPHLNRLFAEDYIQAASSSRFTLDKLALLLPAPPPPEVQVRLQALHPGRSHFGTRGLLIVGDHSP